MVSLRNTLLALASAAAVSADYWVDPQTVPLSTRKQWCTSELSSCPLICEQVEPRTTLVNTCDPGALTYGCLCGNNLQPNVSEYSLTLPYFVCTEWGNQCVTSCGSDNTCASACREDHPCGALSPRTNYTTTTSSAEPTGTGAAATTSANQVFDGIPGATTAASSSSDDTTNKNAAAALEFGRGYGLAVIAGSLFAGFAMVL